MSNLENGEAVQETQAKEAAKPTGSVLYVRLDEETALALKLTCFHIGRKKQDFVLELLRRELGMLKEPEPDPGVAAGVPEVAPDGAGKSDGAYDCPEPSASAFPETTPTETNCPPAPTPLFPGPIPSPDVFSLSPLEAQALQRKVVRRTSRTYPEGFENTPGLLEFAAGQGLLRPAEEFEQFHDHHLARGSCFLDWLAAWRTWVRNALKHQARNMPNVQTLQAARQTDKQRVANQIFGGTASTTSIEGVFKRLPG